MLASKRRTVGTTISGRETPSIAIIGCGAIAQLYYLPALARHPAILEKLILVDRNQARLRQLGEQFNVKTYLRDYRELLAVKIDGVIIATPSHLHYPIALDFLAQGIPILCEKPLAEKVEHARAMVNMAQETGAVILTNYMRRLYASYIKVKELLSSAALGEPLSIHYYEGEEFRWPTASGFYFNTKVSDRGVLLDRGAHVLDLICWWLGEKPGLISSQNDSFGGREAVAEVQFSHRRCTGQVKLSLLGKIPCVFKVVCEQGTMEGDVFDFQNLILTTKQGQKKHLKFRSDENYYTDFGRTIVNNFLNVICNGDRPLISGRDVLDSVEFIDECYAAATRFPMPWYNVLETKNGRG